MIDYLLDTNIVSELVRHPSGHVAERAARIGEHRIGISVIAAAELRYGIVRRRSPRLTRQVEATLDLLSVMPFTVGCDQQYAQIRADLEQRGLMIGANDILIAAHVLMLDVVLVTDNVREFERIEKLRLENWLR